MKLASISLILALAVMALAFAPASVFAQEPARDTAADAAATDETNADAAAPSTRADRPAANTPVLTRPAGTTEPAGDTVDEGELTEEPGAESMDDEVPSRQPSLPAGGTQEPLAEQATEQITTATGQTAPTTSDGGMSAGLQLFLVLALVVGAVALGNYLAKQWKMPDHGWKISLVLAVMIVSIFICAFGEFKFGPDLAGGITLIYELDETSAVEPQATSQTGASEDEQQIRAGGREFQLRELIAALKKRLDPDGTKEITIRAYGQAVEIIIPETGEDEMEFVKRRITDLGQLEFRITADSRRSGEDRAIIEQAKLLPPSQKNVMLGGNKVAEWVAYDVAEFGPVDEPDESGLVKRLANGRPEAVVLTEPDALTVTGEYLASASKGLDETGSGLAVHFSFDRRGAQLFRRLTSQNKPNPATPNVYRHLGIVLDKMLLSAPRIITTISDKGTISGGNMTEREVEHIIEVLNAGSLPAALNKTPISQEVISPTLGAETIEKGKVAIAGSMIAVVLFMLVYYRFAGIVACLALTFNLLLVMSLMVMIKAAFTLPGLAGLVLTIGMAVDANVLIYERIREELKSGAALRMAIRNGFGRAMSAIIDSNVTTIITGIVLFYIGTDQVKGFAVTLILGILTSMFTAIFFARLVFDVAERRGWVKHVRMMKILSQPNYNFLGARWVAIGLSLALIAIGMVAVYFRGAQLLDIDFTGGSSVTFALKPSERMPISDVRAALTDSELADKNLLIVERGTTNTRYQLDTSEQSVDKAKQIVNTSFGDKLMTFSLEFSDLKPYTEGDFTGVEAKLRINTGEGYSREDGVSHDALRESIRAVLADMGHEGIEPILTNPNYQPGSGIRYKEWTVRFVGLDDAAVTGVLEKLKQEMAASPLFPLANEIGGRVSSNMQVQALYAIVISLAGVIAYLWLRFQKVTYGLAAGAALVHDVLVTIGMMALSAYIVSAVPPLAEALQLEAFQINLTIVAALLTIIGYSLNDTIVTFDRLREIKGKSPTLTPQMVNASVNQCLSRTILTALTVFLVVVILYFFGGEGIHSFAFAFLVGVVAGTYSTVYIAAPVLLWLSGASLSTAKAEAAA
ncbi:MAG TPA: protein translocase subunit SecD [Lacipirellulaceae bacterium]